MSVSDAVYRNAVSQRNDRITELEQSLTECKHDKAKGMEASLKRIAALEAQVEKESFYARKQKALRVDALAKLAEMEALLRDAMHRIGDEGFDARWKEAAKELLGDKPDEEHGWCGDDPREHKK